MGQRYYCSQVIDGASIRALSGDGRATLERVGIGIITYNRRDLLQETIARVRKYTCRDDTDLVVADDGSTDGTVAMLRHDDVPVVTGVNMGIAWNKNRALYLLAQIRRCEVVLLLEDDTLPNRTGWERDWIEATSRMGHVNFAGDWLDKAGFVGGDGTADDPIMGRQITAQCAGYSREALDWAGYFDSRFRGYGHEHVEHSRRLVRCGYGGTERWTGGEEEVLYAMIKCDFDLRPAASTLDAEQVACNLTTAHAIMSDHNYRAPWRNLSELRQFRAEIRSAVETRPQGFALHPSNAADDKGQASASAGLLRLFGRRS